jgi:outer membrane immunogenic protein
MRFVGSALVALVLSVGSAAAADLPRALPTKAPAMVAVPAYNWTGVYGGVYVGYHSGDMNISDCVGICPINPTKLSGGFAGVKFGGDYQFANRVVLGGFVSIPVWSPDTTITPFPGINFTMESKFLWVVAGRVGYAFDNVLPFAFAGYASAKIEGVSQFNGITNTVTHDGFVAGAGVEWAFARNWSLDLTYTYMDMSAEPYNFGGGIVRWSGDSQNVSLGVNYRFNL